MKKGFLFIGILIIIYSCDCAYNYEFYVNNKTDQQIKIQLKTHYPKIDTIIQIAIGEEKLILNTSYFPGGGCPGLYKDDFNNIIDTIIIYKSDTIKSKKNFLNYKYLNFSEVNKRTGTFKIDVINNDF